MKDSLTDDLKSLFANARDWMKLEVEYVKLTAVEKATILASFMAFGAVCLLLGVVVLILLSLALEKVFEMMMPPALAFLSTAGVILVLLIIVFLLRNKLLFNPIARFLTKLLIEK